MPNPTVLSFGPSAAVQAAIAAAVPAEYLFEYIQFEAWSFGVNGYLQYAINESHVTADPLADPPRYSLRQSLINDDAPIGLVEYHRTWGAGRLATRIAREIEDTGTGGGGRSAGFGAYFDEDNVYSTRASVQFHFDEASGGATPSELRGLYYIDTTKDVETNANALALRRLAILQGMLSAQVSSGNNGPVSDWPGVYFQDSTLAADEDDPIENGWMAQFAQVSAHPTVTRYKVLADRDVELSIIDQVCRRMAAIAASRGKPLYFCVRGVDPENGLAEIPDDYQRLRFRTAIRAGCSGVAIWEDGDSRATVSARHAEIAHEEALLWRPSMALSVGTTARNAVGIRVFGEIYPNLDTREQSIIDSALTDALTQCNQIAEHFGLAANSAPDEWAPWYHALGSKKAGHGTGRFNELVNEEQDAREIAFNSYDSLQTGDSNTYGAFTLQQIRVQVRRTLAMLADGRMRLASVNDVDRVFYDVMSMVWNRAQWSFRERPVTMTIAPDETVTFSPSLTPGSILTRQLWHTDSTKEQIIFVDRNTMSDLKSRGTTAGRPTRFWAYRDGESGSNVIKYQFWPTPDANYDVRAVVTLDGPPTITAVDAAADLDVFPAGIRPIMLDLTIARLMAEKRIDGGERREALATERLEQEIERIDDLGEGDKYDMTPRDVRGAGTLDPNRYESGSGSFTFPSY